MRAVRTTRCGAAGRARELELAVDDDALAPQLEQWRDALEERVAAGAALAVDDGTVVLLDGWPFTVVSGAADADALHALDLTTPGDAAPRWLASVDAPARFAMQQRDVCDAVELPPVATAAAPHYLMGIDVCPHWRSRVGSFLMARSTPALPTGSGWALKCSIGCHEDRGDGAWSRVTVVDLCQRRPGLVRYLALPAGSVVEDGALVDEGAPRVAFSTEPLDVNLARLPHPGATRQLSTRLARRERAAFWARWRSPAPVPLDAQRDRDVLGAVTASNALEIVMERYGVGVVAARATLAGASTVDGVRARFRAELSDEQYAAVVAILAGGAGERERWKLHQQAGRKLRELTGKPFQALVAVAAAVDAALDDARRTTSVLER